MKKVILIVAAIALYVSAASSYNKKPSVAFFQQSFPNITGTMAPVSVFDSVADQDCQVSTYIEEISLPQGVITNTIWTDNHGPTFRGSSIPVGSPQIVHMAANTSIQVGVDDQLGNQRYNLYVSGMCQ